MNPYRDEAALVLGERRFVLRPTFDALAQIEGQTGFPILELAQRFGRGKIATSELHAIVAAGIKGGGEQVPAELGTMILNAGFINVMDFCTKWLTGALAGEQGLPAEKGKPAGEA